MNNMLLNPQGLSQLGQVPLMYANQAYDWMKQAQGADQATLADIMAQRQRQAQQHPLDMQQKQATLEQTMANTKKLGMDNQVREGTIPQEIEAKIAEFAAQADEAKWKVFQAKVEMGATQGDPKMVALYKNMPKWLAEREKHKEELELTNVRANAQVKSAGLAADARVTSATTPKPEKLSNNPYERYYQLSQKLATLNPNSPEAVQLRKEIAAIQPGAQEVADDRAAGDITQDAGGKWGARKPGALPVPGGATPQPAPAVQQPKPAGGPLKFTAAELNWLQRAKADPRNAGVSEQALIEFGMANGKIAKR